MRILHVVPTYFPATRYGGPIESVHALNKWLVREGAEVDVFTTAIDGPANLNVPFATPLAQDGVRVHYFEPGLLRSWFYSAGMHAALNRQTSSFDIVHITSVFLAASSLAGHAARAAGKPYLISPRGSLMRAPVEKKSALKKKVYLAAIEKRNLARASAIHFTAPIEEAEYRELGLPLRRPLTIPNGLDTDVLPAGDPAEFRKAFGIDPEKKIVLFLSRLSWKKGLDTLVESFAGLLGELPDTVLVVAGGDDEGYRAKVEEMIAAAGVGKEVFFTGELKGAMRSSAYRAADVFVLPSYAENFGIAVAEAMHFGVPVVVTPEVGLAPSVDRAEAGFVVKKDVLQVKFALYKLLVNPLLAREMGARGKELAAREFSYASVAKQFMDAYAQLIRGGGPL